MEPSPKPDHDSYRAIVLRHNGTELLVAPTQSGLVLPSVEIPRQRRVAENLTHALNRQWGCEAVCLFIPDIVLLDKRPNRAYGLLEYCQDAEAQNLRTVWVSVSSLSAKSFEDSADYLALQRSLAQLVHGLADKSQPFGRLGWFRKIETWVKEVIRPLGFELTGKFRQFNASPSFSLIRFETTGPTLWFKAVGEPNEREFPITTTLARLFPRYLPAIVASQPACHGWLMKDGGAALVENPPSLDQWTEVAAGLASLQIESIGHSQELLRAGAEDLRISRLLDLVDPFFDIIRTLMRQQTKTSPPPLSGKTLFELGMMLKDSLHALDAIGFPVSLGHTDLNPGNVLATGDGFLFIDWAEAHIGHPFFTFEYLVSHLRRDCPDVAPFEDLVRTAYTQQWKYVVPAQSIAEAFVFSPLIGVFAYALTCNWRSSPESHNPQTTAYLRSLTRRMKREADALYTGRMPCLQC